MTERFSKYFVVCASAIGLSLGGFVLVKAGFFDPSRKPNFQALENDRIERCVYIGGDVQYGRDMRFSGCILRNRERGN